MTEEHLKKISLFFFLLTLDENRARNLSSKCWAWCLNTKTKSPKLHPDSVVLLALAHFWESLKNENRTGVARFSLDAGWALPADVKIEPWLLFHRTATDEEMWTALLCQILRYPTTKISETLGLTQGTLRYRLSRAVRRMGRIALEQGGFM